MNHIKGIKRYIGKISLIKPKLLKKKVGGGMNIIVKRPVTPLESLTESLKEMQLIRSGKKKKKTWRELKNELRDNSDR